MIVHRIRRLPILLFVCILMTTVFPLPQASASDDQWGNAITLYVAVNGNDAWSGTLPEPNVTATDGPLRTIAQAREKVRLLKQTAEQPIAVYIRGGTYELDDTLLFTPEDSGTESKPIMYAAYPGETPVISGGRAVVSSWTEYGGGIYYTDVDSDVYAVGSFRSLFVDGSRAVRARYPNKVPNDDAGAGSLYAYPDNPAILAGLAQNGDYVQYAMTAPSGGVYDIWVGYATTLEGNEDYFTLEIDGQPISLGSMPASGGYRTVKYSKVGSASLTAGSHTLKLSNTSAQEEHRVHFDAVVLTTNTGMQPSGYIVPKPAAGESRIVVQAENNPQLTGSQSSSLPFTTFVATPDGMDRYTIVSDANRVKASWANDPEARISLVTGLQYYNSFLHIDSINESLGIVKVSGAEALDTITPGNHYFVEGVKEELDAEGEWYYDSGAGRLYYKPVGGKHPALSAFAVPRLDRLIELAGDAEGTGRVQWITFRGLSFKHSADHVNQTSLRTPTDAAVRLSCASHIRIENSSFTNIDGFGIWLHLDSRYNVLTGNTIEHMGAGGVLFTSAKLGYGNASDIIDSRPAVQQYAPLQNEVTRNVIRYGNEVRAAGAGVLLDSRPDATALEPGNLIAFNDISDMSRQGVFGFRNQAGNIVAYNRITNVMTSTSDAGAINFANMNNVQSPSIIAHNVISGAVGKNRTKEGEYRTFGFGIYTDWESSHYRIHHNSVGNTGEGSYLNKGQFNVAMNNVFVNDRKQNVNFIADSQMIIQNHMFHNVIAQTDSSASSWKFANFPANAIEAHSDMIVKSDRNLYWNAGAAIALNPLGSLAVWQTNGQDTSSIVSDPLFTDPAAGDYSLQPGTPAAAVGFAGLNAANNAGVTAGTYETLDVRLLAPVYSRVTPAVYGRAAQFAASVPADGLYMMYAERASHATPVPPLAITVRHANGISNSVFNEWLPPGSKQVYNFPVYIGTYEFRSGEPNTVLFKDLGIGQPDLPLALKLVRYNEMNEPVSYLREAQLAAPAVKLDIGASEQVTVQGFMDDYTKADLNEAVIQFASDNPAVAAVSVSGYVYAAKQGTARIGATVTLNGVTVNAAPVKLQVGPVPESMYIRAARSLLETGQSVQLSVYGVMDTGETVPLTDGLSFTSSNPSSVSVSSTGLLTAHSPGLASITASWDGMGLAAPATVIRAVYTDQALPLLRYSFDEAAAGTAAALDSGKGSAAAGTFFGSAVRTPDTPGGKSAGALNLDFTPSGYVSPGLPASNKADSLNEMTVSFWMKLNSAPAQYDRFFSKGSAFEWTANGGTLSSLQSYVTIAGKNYTLPVMNVGTGWNFYAITYDKSKLNVYRGDVVSAPVLVGSFTATGAPSAPTYELRIGGTPLTTANRTPPAYVDDFRIYELVYPETDLNRVRLDNLP